MTQEEVRAYYDIPENAQAMCDLLMGAHPGWRVWRRDPDHVFRVPMWCARRDSWPRNCRPLRHVNAGILNEAIFMMERGVMVA